MAYSEGKIQVEITKDHEAGLKVGEKKWLTPNDARALVTIGIAKLTDAESPKKTK